MTTFLIFHILVASLSVLGTLALYIRPSRLFLRISYSLITLTTGSGVVLIVRMSGDILGTCLFGLGFVALVLTGIVLGQKKLSLATQEGGREF